MSIEVEITGRVEGIGELERITEKFAKRTILVMQEGERFNHCFPIDLLNKRAELADGVAIGDEVQVKCNLNSRYWEKGEKYFIGIDGFALEVVAKNPQAAAGQGIDTDGDDLPF